MLRIGIRAHDMGKYNLQEIEELASLVEKLGGNSIQLALNKSFIEFQNIEGKLTPGLGKFLKKEFDKYNLDVAILGSYINMGNPNKLLREKEIKKFKEHLFFAKYLGNPLVGTETGSFTEDYKYTELNSSQKAFDIFLDTLIQIVAEAEKQGAIVAMEGVTKHIISSPKKMKIALDKVCSNNLQVIFDPVNYLDIDNYLNQDNIIKESFELFGDKIQAIHLKDFIIINNEFKVVPIGQGQLNIELILCYLKKYKPHIDILLENSNPEVAEQCILYLNKIYDKI